MIQDVYSRTIAIIGIVTTFLFGAFDLSLKILIVFIALDFFSGVLKAIYTNSISSRIGYKGIVRKAGILIIVIIANLLDNLTGVFVCRTAIIWFFIGTEGMSILENLALLNIPLPQFITDKLIQIKNENIPKEKDRVE